jgi:hypothetical protein
MMPEAPIITATTTDDEIAMFAAEMWPCIDLPMDEAMAVFAEIARAYRHMVRGGVDPARAVTAISAMALFMSGKDYDEVPGSRVKVRP